MGVNWVAGSAPLFLSPNRALACTIITSSLSPFNPTQFPPSQPPAPPPHSSPPTPQPPPHHHLELMWTGLQVRAGTGGDEASLWAADLVRMYQRYADTQGWKVSFLNASEGENGGFKEAVLQVCLAFTAVTAPSLQYASCVSQTWHVQIVILFLSH